MSTPNSRQSNFIDVDDLHEGKNEPGCITKMDSDLSSIPASCDKGALKTTGLDDEHDNDDNDEALAKKKLPQTSSDDGSSRGKPKAIRGDFEVDVDELTLQFQHQIEAMPDNSQAHSSASNSKRRRQQRAATTVPRTPGAHAVGGRPFGCTTTATRSTVTANAQLSTGPRSSIAVCRHDDDEEMALEAAVVDHGDDTTNTAEGTSSGHLAIEVIEGKALPDTHRRKASQTKSESSPHPLKWIYLLAILIGVGAAVILAIVLTTADSEDSSDRSPYDYYGPDLHVHYLPFLDDLPAGIVMEIEKHDTPECRANQWMWQDPRLERYSKERQLQRFAMVVFYFYTIGDEWFHNDHWLDYQTSECDWYQSYNENDDPICDEDSNLLIFDFHSNNLQGSLPGLTNFYPHLRWFNVANNNLKGPPPPLASKIKNLEAFILSNNQLEGQLIGDAGFVAFNVRIVKLDGNSFSGYVNPVFRVLPKLEILNLTSNAFANDVPFQLEYTNKLTYLGMADNQWYGTLPTELSALTDLQEMDWAGNKNIIGTIPSEFAALTNLQQLDVIGTQITGTIPQALCERHHDAEDEEVEETEAFTALEIVANCSQVECCK